MSGINNDKRTRCAWCETYGEHAIYHDEEWGVPVHDDKKWFEFLVLDSFQAGLSWLTILKKREGFRKAFHNFNVKKVAKMTEKDVEKQCQNTAIVRNKLKIRSTISNAQYFMELQKEFGSFDQYIWQFTNHKTIQNKWTKIADVPVTTKESDAMSKDLKSRGFKFVGSTICYAFMQAAGMVNDHVVDCYRWKEVKKLAKK